MGPSGLRGRARRQIRLPAVDKTAIIMLARRTLEWFREFMLFPCRSPIPRAYIGTDAMT